MEPKRVSMEDYKDGEVLRGESVQGAGEVSWFVQPRAEEDEGRPLACSSPHRQERRAIIELFSLDSNRT